MIRLLLVSFIWAFSFGLIKGKLNDLDPVGMATVRLGLSGLVFLPFLRWRKIHRATAGKLALTGAVQFGAMYILYLRAYHYLHAYEVALFTIFTPLYLALFDAAAQHRFALRQFAAAALSVAGAAVVIWQSAPTREVLAGFLLVQASNICFASGQLAYRRIRAVNTTYVDREIFAILYGAALVVTLLTSAVTTPWASFRPQPAQWLVLVYLGVIASGLGFFWWNVGARQVNLGTLAVFNNAKVPLAVACSLLFFHESADVLRLLIGGALLVAAVILAERNPSAG